MFSFGADDIGQFLTFNGGRSKPLRVAYVMLSLLSKPSNTMASLKVAHHVFYRCTTSILILLVQAVFSIASLFLLVALATFVLVLKLLERIPSSLL